MPFSWLAKLSILGQCVRALPMHAMECAPLNTRVPSGLPYASWSSRHLEEIHELAHDS